MSQRANRDCGTSAGQLACSPAALNAVKKPLLLVQAEHKSLNQRLPAWLLNPWLPTQQRTMMEPAEFLSIASRIQDAPW
jgi:hypothetical protein